MTDKPKRIWILEQQNQKDEWKTLHPESRKLAIDDMEYWKKEYPSTKYRIRPYRRDA